MGQTNPLNSGTILNGPHPYALLPILIPQAVNIPCCKATPSIIGPREYLDCSHLITLFCKRSDIPVKEIVFLVKIIEEFFTGIPVLERHDLGIELVLIQLHNGSRMVEDSVVVGPITHSFRC